MNFRRGKDKNKEFLESTAKKTKRRLKAREQEGHGFWFGLGMMGLIGWSVAIPSLLGLAAGLLIDSSFQSGFSWTLMLLTGGVIIGCLNAWFWIKKEQKSIHETEKELEE